MYIVLGISGAGNVNSTGIRLKTNIIHIQEWYDLGATSPLCRYVHNIL